MIQIFVGDKPIILTTVVERETNFKNYLLDTVNIGKVLKEIKTKEIAAIRLIDSEEEGMLKKFLKLLPNVIAAGGKVFNSNGKILFIYRNNKWDLPKGKAESRETIDKTAIREVEEETGVSGLSIVKPLEMTYHIFKRNGKHKIKITYWFEMQTDFNGQLFPQEKEGITKVEWLNDDQVKVALANSYANIKLLVN
ncbi:MAG: NUDIX domain-containing protein [Flavobacteriaceae bacterium]|nr:NUDIX domain-containing protein [Flavobacteriaceae bacterium]